MSEQSLGRRYKPVDPRRVGGPIRPGGARLFVAGLGALAMVVALLPRSPPPPLHEVTFTYAFSTDAANLLDSLIKDFNKQGREVKGRRIRVDPLPIASGDAEAAILGGTLQPVAWTPASSAWGRLLNHHVSANWAPDSKISLVQSPQVIAMWEQLAQVLGYGSRALGWGDIIHLAASKRGWAEYGRPDLGAFRLGHTNPNISTSGLLAAASAYHAITGKPRLSRADVGNPDVRAKVRTVERSVVHYGDTADRFLERMNHFGFAFANAVFVQEQSLVRFNKGRTAGSRLIGIYPVEGTFVADYPFIVMNAGWVSADQRAAANQLMNWLQKSITLQIAAANGFRLRNRAVSPIDQTHGANPDEPKHPLDLPSGDVLAVIQSTWNQDRKPASVMIAVDTSQSMSEEGRLTEVQTALPHCLDELGGDDRAGLVSFGDGVTPRVALGPYALNRTKIKSSIAGLLPSGRTALYDATLSVARAVAVEGKRKRIEAVVILTDGKDDVSKSTLDGLLRYLESLIEAGGSVRVFAVVYGSSADRAALQRIVDASQGQLFIAKRGDISNVCRAIFSFF